VTGPLRWQHLVGADGSAFRRRTVADGRGTVWTVSEQACAGVPGARRDRCLVFASEHALRRVYDYPDDWRPLPTAALVAISERR
jgi:hypothetical protein